MLGVRKDGGGAASSAAYASECSGFEILRYIAAVNLTQDRALLVAPFRQAGHFPLEASAVHSAQGFPVAAAAGALDGFLHLLAFDSGFTSFRKRQLSTGTEFAIYNASGAVQFFIADSAPSSTAFALVPLGQRYFTAVYDPTNANSSVLLTSGLFTSDGSGNPWSMSIANGVFLSLTPPYVVRLDVFPYNDVLLLNAYAAASSSLFIAFNASTGVELWRRADFFFVAGDNDKFALSYDEQTAYTAVVNSTAGTDKCNRSL